MRFFLVAIFFLFSYTFAISQSESQLWEMAKNEKNHDTVRLAALYDLAWVFVYNDPDSTYSIAEVQLKLAQKTRQNKWEAKAYNAMGAALQNRSAFSRAIECYQKGLKIYESLNDTKNMAGALGNIGSVYIAIGDANKALEYQLKCLELVQKVGLLEGVASSLNNICIIYADLKDNKKALFYGEQAAEMYKLLKDDYGLSSALANIGKAYANLKNSEKAMNFYKLSLNIAEKNNFADKILETKRDLAELYYSQKKYDIAIKISLEVKKMAMEGEDIATISGTNRLLADAYYKVGNLKAAYECLNDYEKTKDTITNLLNLGDIARLEAKMEFDKKNEADSIRNAEAQHLKDVEILAKSAQIEKDRIQKIALYGGILFMIISGGIMYNRFRFIRKQKNIIEKQSKETEEQKIIIEEKQKEILSSISYAKRLQEAILPPKNAISNLLPQSFILYKPKDIVAGDFYWLEHKQKKIMIAAADCTGHGVPGALVSVVCSNALNRAVNEFEFTEPGKILDKTRELVVETFERSEMEVKDGMDISLAVIDKDKNLIQWAGANNPLWIIRNSELIEFKPNKQAIGKVDNPVEYKTHEISLLNGDCLYIFTDGYADQFGGPNGKKFKYRQLYDLMIELSQLSIVQQKEKLDKEFNEWKGNLEQVDDVCVIGIKI